MRINIPCNIYLLKIHVLAISHTLHFLTQLKTEWHAIVYPDKYEVSVLKIKCYSF